MLDIHQIEQYYPENLRGFRRFILREYLQYKILEIVFNGPHANKLVFLGGTCLRIAGERKQNGWCVRVVNYHLYTQ